MMAASLPWRDSPSFRRLSDCFDDPAASDPQVATDRALDLLGDRSFADTLLDPLIDSLGADPLFQPPLPSNMRDGRAVLSVFDTPVAHVSVSLNPIRGDQPSPVSVVLGNLSVSRFVRVGDARVGRWRADPVGHDFDAGTAAPAAEIAPIVPVEGMVVVQPATEGQVIEAAHSDIIRITALIRAGSAPLMREYAVADGSFLRATSNDEQSSRAGMLLTMLRLQRRTDAALLFDAATRDPAFHVRWSSMREWLALDAVAALPRLREMATTDPNREVRDAASVTLSKVLTRLEQRACPA